MNDYCYAARYDAKNTVREYSDAIVEQLVEDGEASNDLFNDYSSGDSYHHESHTDKSYNLGDAARVLEDLSEHTETDKGLWEGLEPREAISAQAAYTYGNAVMSEWGVLIEEINEKAEEIIGHFDDQINDTENEDAIDKLETDKKAALVNLVNELSKC